MWYSGNTANPLRSHLQVGVSSLASSSDEEYNKGRHELSEHENEGAAPDLLNLSHFIFDQFSDAKAKEINGPGRERFHCSQARKRWRSRNQPSFPTLLRYIAHFYKVSNDSTKGHFLVINLTLGQYSFQKARDVPSRIAAADLSRMEEVIRFIQEIQNFQFWIFGAS
ncbi:hypothetical protein E2C01_056573 [Portunus trituberculatus]|uniref:Uncharacterized protein n=1 Tax=Portunus trituberculatus TaxID=210409 RepID=A0A5B7GZY1_PORTR|nr:hypothetical protein [Portunus trituberculatus]